MQAGTHLLENDGTLEQLIMAYNYCIGNKTISWKYKFYGLEEDTIHVFDMENRDNLPTIKTSTFFIDEPDEPMINISLTRLEELVQKAIDEMENNFTLSTFKNGVECGINKLHELLKLEAK